MFRFIYKYAISANSEGLSVVSPDLGSGVSQGQPGATSSAHDHGTSSKGTSKLL